MRPMARRELGLGLGPVQEAARGIGRGGIKRHVIGGLFVGGADAFAPGIGAVGVDVFVLGEVQGLDENGEKRIPRCSRDDTRALAAIGLAGLKTAATTAKSRSLATLRDDTGALAAIALPGLKTRHYNGEKQVPRCAWDDTSGGPGHPRR